MKIFFEQQEILGGGIVVSCRNRFAVGAYKLPATLSARCCLISLASPILSNLSLCAAGPITPD